MSLPRFVAAGLVLASALAAWLRFDAGSPLAAWIVLLVSLAGAVAGWLANARRLPRTTLPPTIEELGNREDLTPEEEARFAAELRSWHERNQRAAWREIERHGPASLVVRRAVLIYLWLAFLAIAVFPPIGVPGTLLPAIPRFALVLAGLAAVAVTVGAVLGLRDWKRIRKDLAAAADV